MMFRSGQKAQSPQRQSIQYSGPDLDSPSRQRIKLLSDKWNQIQTGIDKDKVEKKELLEERLSIIEEHIQAEKPRDEQRFKVLKDQVLKLQDFTVSDKHERENFDEKRDRDLKTLQDGLQNAFEQERIAKQNNDLKANKQIDERFTQLNLTNTRNTHQYEDRTQLKLGEVNQQISLIKTQIEQERRSREESAEGLGDQIESEINKFQDQLLIEKKVREETQSKIFRMIEDIHTRLLQEISIEKKERSSTTEALLKLLEDACIKIDKNFRS